MIRHTTMLLESTARYLCCPALAAALILLLAACPAGAVEFHVSPAGSDDAAGTQDAPFATLSRARAAAREAAPKMDADIVVSLAPGVYRLDATLELTEADSGRNGHRVIYRSAGGPGRARILGSTPLTGWQEHRDLRVSGCGQDSGDMGALHCANLNLPDGDAINTFEQITVDDCRAIPSMKDRGPNAVFLDWPKMSMHQVFRNIRVRGMQDRDIVSHGPDNAASAVKENLSWEPGFSEELMDYENIGLTDEFPEEYGGRTR